MDIIVGFVLGYHKICRYGSIEVISCIDPIEKSTSYGYGRIESKKLTIGVSAYFGDTPISVLLQGSLISMICVNDCLAYLKCKNNPLQLVNCQKFTLQTLYMIKCLSYQNLMSNIVFPYPGT